MAGSSHFMAVYYKIFGAHLLLHSLSMNMMATMNNLFIYFAFVFITVVSSDKVEESCVEMFTDEFFEEDCCETVFEGFEDLDQNFEGCKAYDPDDSEEGKCDSVKCSLKNLGIWKEDKFNNEAAKKRLENMEMKYPKNKKIAQRISKQCLDDKYLVYGTEDICPAMRYFICEYINTILECDSWKKTEKCSKNSEYASKCKAAIDSAN